MRRRHRLKWPTRSRMRMLIALTLSSAYYIGHLGVVVEPGSSACLSLQCDRDTVLCSANHHQLFAIIVMF